MHCRAREAEYIVDSDDAPEAGDINVIIYTGGIYTPGGDNNGSLLISEVALDPIDTDQENLKGEIFTFERLTDTSSKIEKTKEVYNGDSPLDLYVGTIYQDDETTPTETWTRNGITETVPILEIMGTDTLEMFQSPQKEFSGDVYGYVPYLSVITINNLSGLFMPIEYGYNAKTNVTRLKLREIFSATLTKDTDYEVTQTFDYGNVVEPTIKG